MKELPEFPRRTVLRAALVLTGAALAASAIPHRDALAQQKASKSVMKYQDKPDGDKQCGTCMHFQPPVSCEIVEGTVAVQGYCIGWVKKA